MGIVIRKAIYAFVPCILFFLLFSCSHQTREKLQEAEAIRNLGEAYFKEGKYTPALKELLKALEMNPDDPYTHYTLGLTYMAKEKPGMAVPHFEEAIELKPDYAPAINNLGTAYLALEKWDDAINTFKKLTNDLLYATPHYPLSNIGFAYYKKGEYETARDYYKKALDQEPSFIIAMYGMGRTQIALGNLKDAMVILKKGEALAPLSPEIQFELGKLYTLINDTGKAKEAFQKVIKLSPDTPLAETAKVELESLPNI